jgi:hypothetical protein
MDRFRSGHRRRNRDLLDAGYLEETLRRHFEPLLDPAFDDRLRRHYRDAIGFEIDGRELARAGVSSSERAAISIRLGRRRTPSATGYIERHTFPPDDRGGIAISTFGKVIKRGWDWLAVTPPTRAHISGLIEAPDLAACLTLSKNDFIRVGPRGASYLGYRKAIQEVVSRQLAEWGDTHDTDARPRTARLERDLERVLEDLADAFPLLRSLVDRRAGGQKRLPMPGRGDERLPASLIRNWAAWWTARFGSTMPIRRTRVHWRRDRSGITLRSPSPSLWRRWRSKHATSTHSLRNSLHTGARRPRNE